MADLALRGVTKRFGAVDVIHGVDLEVRHGEFVAFVGPSGCGKSTLLRMICGLEPVSAGDVLIGGRRVNDLPAAQRGLALVFQSYALYPHMTVRQNMAFGLENLRTPKAEVEARIAEAARMLRLEPFLARKPSALSGGQRQRVAIGRAIVREPEIFLFDEPLSNLDAELRVGMRAELSALHRRLGTTMIYVTHDQVEAMTMADTIVVLRGGRVEQAGPPLGAVQRAGQPVRGGVHRVATDELLPGTGAGGRGRMERRWTWRSLGSVTRAGACGPARRGHGDAGHPARALAGSPRRPARDRRRRWSSLAASSYVRLAQHEAVLQLAGQTGLRPGDTVHLRSPPEHLHLFNADGATLVARQ